MTCPVNRVCFHFHADQFPPIFGYLQNARGVIYYLVGCAKRANVQAILTRRFSAGPAFAQRGEYFMVACIFLQNTAETRVKSDWVRVWEKLSDTFHVNHFAGSVI